MFLENNCINNGVTNDLKQKKEKQQANNFICLNKREEREMEVNGQLEPTHKTYVPYSQIISNNNTTQIKKKARKTLIDEGKGAQARLNDG